MEQVSTGIAMEQITATPTVAATPADVFRFGWEEVTILAGATQSAYRTRSPPRFSLLAIFGRPSLSLLLLGCRSLPLLRLLLRLSLPLSLLSLPLRLSSPFLVNQSFALAPLALVVPAISVGHSSPTMQLAVAKLAHVAAAVGPGVGSPTVHLVAAPLAIVAMAVGRSADPPTMEVAIAKLPHVAAAVGESQRPLLRLSVPFTRQPISFLLPFLFHSSLALLFLPLSCSCLGFATGFRCSDLLNRWRRWRLITPCIHHDHRRHTGF